MSSQKSIKLLISQWDFKSTLSAKSTDFCILLKQVSVAVTGDKREQYVASFKSCARRHFRIFGPIEQVT